MAKKNPWPRGTRVQSLVFDKARFSAREARSWASQHDFRAPATDQTKNEIRLRQESPSRFMEGTFRRTPIKNGVDAIIAVPKKAAVAKKKKTTPSKNKSRVKKITKK